MASDLSQLGISEDLLRPLECARAALDQKAENLKVLDLTEIAGFTDYFVICSGTSDRQVRAIVDEIMESLKEMGAKPLACEGYTEGRWVLVDFGDIVVHVFQEALREYYDLESLWADAPRVKIPDQFYGPGGSPVH